MQTPIRRFLMLVCLSLCAPLSRAALSPDMQARNQPQAPFRIIGDVYYVGASDIASYLIVTSKGLILLDSGLRETVPQVTANIATLGFKLADVKILLNSHAHYDHAGGLAELKRLTHASLAASAEDAALMARGGKGDFSFGDTLSYEPVQADRILKDGDRVELGGVTLTAHLTPGHTKGCTTWTMRVTDAAGPHDVLFMCGLSLLDYPLVNNPNYPNIAADFTHSFEVLKSLPCEVFLGAHGQYYGLQAKIGRMRAHAPGNPFIDPQGCRKYIDGAEAAFIRRLAEQQQAAAGK